jgi:hypothetical protein
MPRGWARGWGGLQVDPADEKIEALVADNALNNYFKAK